MLEVKSAGRRDISYLLTFPFILKKDALASFFIAQQSGNRLGMR